MNQFWIKNFGRATEEEVNKMLALPITQSELDLGLKDPDDESDAEG